MNKTSNFNSTKCFNNTKKAIMEYRKKTLSIHKYIWIYLKKNQNIKIKLKKKLKYVKKLNFIL